VTYQGALATKRRQMAWNACMVFVFNGLAVPQRAIPYDQIGCSKDLYSTSLSEMYISDFNTLKKKKYLLAAGQQKKSSRSNALTGINN